MSARSGIEGHAENGPVIKWEKRAAGETLDWAMATTRFDVATHATPKSGCHHKIGSRDWGSWFIPQRAEQIAKSGLFRSRVEAPRGARSVVPRQD